MTENIFTKSDDNPKTIPDTVPVDQLVGEDKPYKTVDDLAKAKLHADGFIDTLKAELQEMRNENSTLRSDISARERLETVLDQLMQQNDSQDDGDLYATEHTETPTSSQPDAIKNIDTLIESKVTQIERERTANHNRAEAIQKLKDAFGSDYVSKLKSRAQELGLTEDELNGLAGRSPKAFVELVVPRSEQRDTPVSIPSSSSGAPISAGHTQTNTADYYKELRKKDPRKYWTPQLQAQLHKDAIKAAREGKEFNLD